MTARVFVYTPAGTFEQVGAIVGDSSYLCVVEGTEAEIRAAIPQGRAFGFPTNNNQFLTYDKDSGWSTNGTPIISKTLATILATVPAVGTVARATDVQGSSLESTGTKWVGCLGVGLSAAQVAPIITTNLGDGAWLLQSGIGYLAWDPISGSWRVSPTTPSAPL